jgi:hypothetical protein
MIPQESMNSQPLQYPVDGSLFVCVLSCKEMKDAGLTLNWAQRVTTTTKVDIPTETIKLINFFTDYPGDLYLVVNCVIQPIQIKLNFEIYVGLKKKFKNSSVFKYKHFVHVLFIENVPVVCYEDLSELVYVTPNEYTNIFQNELKSKFPLNANFCSLYNDLTPYTRHSLPTKITVSLNNWKGGCYNITNTSSAEYIAFLESPGYNTGTISKGDYTYLAELSNPLLEVPKSAFKPLFREYTDTLHPEHSEILLYVAFAERGACVEDGFIVDKELTERGPKQMVNVNFSIRLSSNTNQPLNTTQLEKMKIKYVPQNLLVDKTIIFGVIWVYDYNIKIQQSKRINVTSTQIDKQYLHTITHVIENPITTNYEISSRENFNNFSVICTYRYYVPIGKGTKLSNSYGQKSEVSAVMDLGQYVGRRISDGALIKPQILMGQISLVGRTPSGQVLDMASSPDCAITATNAIISPQKFVISSILSCTKIAPSPKRIDMLTGPNCFDGNELAQTNLLLNQQKNTLVSAPKKLQRALNLIAYKGTTLSFKSNTNYNFNSFITT